MHNDIPSDKVPYLDNQEVPVSTNLNNFDTDMDVMILNEFKQTIDASLQ